MATLTLFSQANVQTAGFQTAFAFAEARLVALLASRTSLRTTGAVPVLGDVAGKGTKTLRDRQIGLGHSLSMTTATSENQTATASTVTLQTGDVAVARHWILLSQTQLSQITDDTGAIKPAGLAASFADSFDGKWNDILCDTVKSFTNDIGTATLDNDLDGAIFDCFFHFCHS